MYADIKSAFCTAKMSKVARCIRYITFSGVIFLRLFFIIFRICCARVRRRTSMCGSVVS